MRGVRGTALLSMLGQVLTWQLLSCTQRSCHLQMAVLLTKVRLPLQAVVQRHAAGLR